MSSCAGSNFSSANSTCDLNLQWPVPLVMGMNDGGTLVTIWNRPLVELLSLDATIS